MPTYEYRCTVCGHSFEQKQSIIDPPLKKCPECQGEVQRLISGGTGFVMKNAQCKTECSFQRTGQTCCGRSTPCSSKD